MSRNVVSIIKLSNNTFKQSAKSDFPSTRNEIMIGQDDETADNYILSMTQNKMPQLNLIQLKNMLQRKCRLV